MSRIIDIDDDRYTFGPVLRLRQTGVFTVETWKDRWADELAEYAWPHFKFTVVAIDQENGIVTLA